MATENLTRSVYRAAAQRAIGWRDHNNAVTISPALLSAVKSCWKFATNNRYRRMLIASSRQKACKNKVTQRMLIGLKIMECRKAQNNCSKQAALIESFLNSWCRQGWFFAVVVAKVLSSSDTTCCQMHEASLWRCKHGVPLCPEILYITLARNRGWWLRPGISGTPC